MSWEAGGCVVMRAICNAGAALCDIKFGADCPDTTTLRTLGGTLRDCIPNVRVSAQMSAEKYFRRVANDVFSPLLVSLGARAVANLPLLVRFETLTWFVEIVALKEDGPKYSPRVEVGPLPQLSRDRPHTQIDIMHFVSEGSPLRRYNLEWCYRDASEMQASFVRVRDEIFQPYAVPQLVNPLALMLLISARSRQIVTQHEQEVAAHNDAVFRAKAQVAKGLNDGRSYLAHMKRIPETRLTDTERKRIAYYENKDSV
jgi:hypothetical protein